MNEQKANLHGWIITFNCYMDRWLAAPSQHKEELFSGDKGHVLKFSDIYTLQDVILRTNGDKALIEQLLKNEQINQIIDEAIAEEL